MTDHTDDQLREIQERINRAHDAMIAAAGELGIGCPTCHTILRDPTCPDPWHYDNRPPDIPNPLPDSLRRDRKRPPMPEDREGCSRKCTEQHTYVWGQCELGVDPGPSPLLIAETSIAGDGWPSTVIRAVTAEKLAAHPAVVKLVNPGDEEEFTTPDVGYPTASDLALVAFATGSHHGAISVEYVPVPDEGEDVYRAVGTAMVPHVGDEERLFEHHACSATCGPCSCSGVPYPSAAVRAAVDEAVRLTEQRVRAEMEGHLQRRIAEEDDLHLRIVAKHEAARQSAEARYDEVRQTAADLTNQLADARYHQIRLREQLGKAQRELDELRGTVTRDEVIEGLRRDINAAQLVARFNAERWALAEKVIGAVRLLARDAKDGCRYHGVNPVFGLGSGDSGPACESCRPSWRVRQVREALAAHDAVIWDDRTTLPASTDGVAPPSGVDTRPAENVPQVTKGQ